MKIWDLDASGSVNAFGDGLMIFKYTLGQRGNELTTNGTLPTIGAPRTSDAAIEGYCTMIEPYLDINGDGVVDFIDGYLILLALIGLTGTNLTDDNIRPAATRTTAEELIAYKNKMITDNP